MLVYKPYINLVEPTLDYKSFRHVVEAITENGYSFEAARHIFTPDHFVLMTRDRETVSMPEYPFKILLNNLLDSGHQVLATASWDHKGVGGELILMPNFVRVWRRFPSENYPNPTSGIESILKTYGPRFHVFLGEDDTLQAHLL